MFDSGAVSIDDILSMPVGFYKNFIEKQLKRKQKQQKDLDSKNGSNTKSRGRFNKPTNKSS